MKKDKYMNGEKLYVARVRVIVHAGSNETDGIVTAHYNHLGYRLCLQKNKNTYIDVLTGKVYPVLNERLKVNDLFIFNPKPLRIYAHSLRANEKVDDIKEYAEYVSTYFNNHRNDEKKWFATKDFVHKIHHKDDENIISK